jgi:ATP-dependent Lon protease
VAQLGLFPLPLVLLPTERVPLHIFEPRYKELIGECIERNEEFGIVLLKADGDIHHVGTRAGIVEVLQVLPDGRINLIVEGRERFRLVEVDHDRAFATGTVEELTDESEPREASDVEHALEVFRRLQETVGSTADLPSPDSPLLDFELAARIDFANERKQELLELTSPRRRMARLAELLEHAGEALALEREIRRRASTNGKVTPLSPGGRPG